MSRRWYMPVGLHNYGLVRKDPELRETGKKYLKLWIKTRLVWVAISPACVMVGLVMVVSAVGEYILSALQPKGKWPWSDLFDAYDKVEEELREAYRVKHNIPAPVVTRAQVVEEHEELAERIRNGEEKW